MRILISLLLLFGAVAFGLGISLPLLRVEKLYFFEETPSLLGLISGLWEAGDWMIAALVAVFSIVFPLLKLSVAFMEAIMVDSSMPQNSKLMAPARWMSVLAKWSMMDVLLVALVIFAAKTSGFATAFAQPGLWFFAASAIAGAAAAHLLNRELSAGSSEVDQEGARSPGS